MTTAEAIERAEKQLAEADRRHSAACAEQSAAASACVKLRADLALLRRWEAVGREYGLLT